jgi:glycosyltransferase involved in cell wall biosynthesis
LDNTVAQERGRSSQENLTRPSFSMVFETENLASVELENIFRSLSSLAAQDISPELANEFWVIDSGNAPPEVIAELCSEYPWISVKEAPGVGYYEAKMLGASLATGEIVVYCDSDCVYVSNWLKSLLSTFMSNPNINVVAGETSTPIRNAYDMAIAMHYFFPRFSGQENAYASQNYFLNNVAFRRDFLIKNPIPTNLPLYRGNCSTHSYLFCQLNGNKILKDPKAKASHEPPSPAFSFWRYLLLGHDYIVQEKILSQSNLKSRIGNISEDLCLSRHQKIKGIFNVALKFNPFNFQKIRAVLLEDKKRLLMFPIVSLIMFYFEILQVIGAIATYINLNFVIDSYYKVEAKDNVSKEEFVC